MKNEDNIKFRENIIQYIYAKELINSPITSVDAFESGSHTEKEIKWIEKIGKNYDIYKKLISMNLKSTWSWNRVSVLDRAILIYGCFELSFNDKALTIDVLIRYAKKFSSKDSYKFINPILQKIGDYYEQIKNKDNKKEA